MFEDNGSLRREYFNEPPSCDEMAELLELYKVRENKLVARDGKSTVSYRYTSLKDNLPVSPEIKAEERQTFLMAFLAGAYSRECMDLDPESRILNCSKIFKEENPVEEGGHIDYIGIELGLDFHAEMLKVAEYAYSEYPNVFSHHITLRFAPNAEQIEETKFGVEFQFTANTIYQTPEIVVAAVQSPVLEAVYPEQRLHVTLATAKGVKPVYSNDVLRGKASNVRIREGSNKIFKGRIVGYGHGNKVVRG